MEELIVPHSGTMINGLIALVDRIIDEHATRMIVQQEVEIAVVIATCNRLPITSFAARA